MRKIAAMNAADRREWRAACAGMEVVQSGNPSLSGQEAKTNVVTYYEAWNKLARKYAPDYPADLVTLFPASGFVMAENS